MSVSVLWVVSAVDAETFRRWSPEWTEVFDGYAARADLSDLWRSWLEPPHADEALRDLGNEVCSGAWPQVYRFLAERGTPEQTDAHVTRRVPATGALFHALGPERGRRLPGFFGAFLLSPDDLTAVLPDLRAAFTMAADERAAVIERLGAALADTAPLDPQDVLDTLPRRGRWAADRSMGLLSVSQFIS